jgi:hypothetical protein
LSGPAVLTRLFRARKQLRALCGEDVSADPKHDDGPEDDDGV